MRTPNPVGYRFHPTDRELLIHYLKPKILGNDDGNEAIAVINVCDFEPWELPAQSKIRSKDQFWYFISHRPPKSRRNRRPNRTTKAGYWKPTGKTRPIKIKGTKKKIGTKRTLVFHKGRPKGVRTKWVITEYECLPDPGSPNQANFALCRLKNKSDEKFDNGSTNHPVLLSDSNNRIPSWTAVHSTCEESEASNNMVPDLEDQIPNEVTAISTHEIGESSCQMVSDSNNYIPNMTTAFLACDIESEPSCNTIPYLEFLIPNEMMAISTDGIGELIWPMALDSANHISNMMSAYSARNPESEPSDNPINDSEFPLLNEVTAISTNEIGESKWLCAFDSDNHIPNMMTVYSAWDFDSEPSYNIILDLDNHFPNEMAPISTCEIGERTCQMAYNPDEQNPDRRTDTPVSREDECCSLSPTASSLASGSLFIEADTTAPYEKDLQSDLENTVAETTFSDTDLLELEAYFQLQDYLCSPLPLPALSNGSCP